jgi:hypothetical protein
MLVQMRFEIIVPQRVFQQLDLLLLKNATDMNGPFRCSSLSLEREEHQQFQNNSEI